MALLILALIPVSFIISFLSTAAVKRIAPKLNFVDKPGHRKIHHVPKALGGGVAIFLGVAGPMAAVLTLVNAFEPTSFARWTSDATNVATVTHTTSVRQAENPVEVHWPGIRQQTPLALKILVAMLLMHLLGLADDRKALGPYFKLFVQLSITAALVIAADLRALTALDSMLGMGKWPSVIVTVLWIGGITNAFNFLDNMDGLSAGVAAVCTLAFLVTALTIGQWFVAAMLALLFGSLIGFLCFNFHPATIFMGDSGSLLIGLVLGVLTVRTTFLPADRDLGKGWYALFAPLIVLAVPLYDLAVVSAIRIGRGKSPLVGDTNHFSHRLVARGMSRRTAVLCIWLVTAATSAAAIVLPHVRTTFAAVMLFVQTLLILGVVLLLEQHPLPGLDESK